MKGRALANCNMLLNSKSIGSLCIVSLFQTGCMASHAFKKNEGMGSCAITYRFRRAKPEDRTEVIFEKLGDYYKEKRFM
jgi:hypothetical protein